MQKRLDVFRSIKLICARGRAAPKEASRSMRQQWNQGLGAAASQQGRSPARPLLEQLPICFQQQRPWCQVSRLQKRLRLLQACKPEVLLSVQGSLHLFLEARLED